MLMDYLISVDWKIVASVFVSTLTCSVVFIWLAYRNGYHNGFAEGSRQGTRFSVRKLDEHV